MRRSFAIHISVASFTAVFTGTPAFANCDTFLSQAQATAAAITVAVEPPERPRAGSPIRINWRNNEGRRLGDSVYLVITTAPDVRFGGRGFIALTAGAKGPHGVAYGADGARAFVPLHRKIEAAKGGEIVVTPYRRGAQTIGWAVVTAGACGEHVLATGTQSVNIAAGPPELVVQDRFALDRPRQRIRSLSGTYELLVFDGHYEVHDVATGARILDRPGIDPNFSPSGRFVAARATADRRLELIDLISGRQFAVAGDGLLVWARNDSYVIYGRSGGGRIGIWNSIVDADDLFQVAWLSCMACSITAARVRLDIDHGYFAAADLDWRVVDLVTREIAPLGEEHFDGSGPRRAIQHIKKEYDSSVSSLKGWDVQEKLALSHEEKWTKGFGYVVRHAVTTLNAPAETFSRATLRGKARSGRDYERAELRPPAPAGGSPMTMFTIFDRLASAGIATQSNASLLRVYLHDVWKMVNGEKGDDGESIAKKLRTWVPAAATVFRESLECNFEGAPDSAIYVDPRYIAQVWQWREGEGDRWLLQTICYLGAAGRGISGALFVLDRTGISNLTDVLGKGALEGFDLTDEESRLHVLRVADALLAVVFPLKDKILLIDPSNRSRVGVEIPLIDSILFAWLRLTEDGRHLVQLNSDGRFFVHRIADGVRVLAGAHVDDEIVITNDEGLYDTTFEGAHAVRVRFPGMGGLHGFYQFEAALYRRGLAAAVLAGRPVKPAPSVIPAPPTAELTLAVAPSGGRRTGEVIATSERDLAAIRLYVDGRLAKTIGATGTRAKIAVDLPDPGGGRWITAVAVDAADLVSLPSAIQIPGPPRPQGTLRAVLVGVNTYEDPDIPPLTAAVADVQNLARALKASEGRAVSAVRTSLLVDARATRESVLAAVHEAAKATGSKDTLVVFYAGHGVDDRASGRAETSLLLTLSTTRMAELSATAISWTELAQALTLAQGTVVVVLDSCHAGLAGSDAFATNDAAVSALLTGAGAPMVVLASSKGRQSSLENSESGAGYFTSAIAAAIAGGRVKHDRDQSGLIDLSELYSAVKMQVMNASYGRQTPWLTRNGLVGEMAIF